MEWSGPSTYFCPDFRFKRNNKLKYKNMYSYVLLKLLQLFALEHATL